ncbi:hypothetical protein JXQ31_13965 [candidate division KSB1 bacterium]|nr:hypothetical protein [candidate division KSB1 bacterium]
MSEHIRLVFSLVLASFRYHYQKFRLVLVLDLAVSEGQAQVTMEEAGVAYY